MAKPIILVLSLFLTGCSIFGTEDPEAKNLLETLEFDEDECGCFRGNVHVDPPFGGMNVDATLHKRKSCPGEDTPPAC